MAAAEPLTEGSSLKRARAEFPSRGGGQTGPHWGDRSAAEANAMPEGVEQIETRTALLCSIVAGGSQLLRLRAVRFGAFFDLVAGGDEALAGCAANLRGRAIRGGRGTLDVLVAPYLVEGGLELVVALSSGPGTQDESGDETDCETCSELHGGGFSHIGRGVVPGPEFGLPSGILRAARRFGGHLPG